MKKKDYELIAEAINEARNSWNRNDSDNAVSYNYAVTVAALNLAGALQRNDPKFNYDKFVRMTGTVIS